MIHKNTIFARDNINEHEGVYCVINKKYAVKFVNKCGCSTLAYLHLSHLGIHTSYTKESPYQYWEEFWSNVHKSNFDGYTKVAIVRDPADRLISASHTICRNKGFGFFISSVRRTFNELPIELINTHIRPQTSFYDYKDIDVFVDLSDLDIWLQNIGCPSCVMNTSKKECLHIPNDVLDLYKEDYCMITNIQDKLWKPSDK